MQFDRLIKIVERLRGPDGCPWDREQTRDSLKPYLIEELYELLDAFEENDPQGIKEELGDLLFQIVLHCQLSKEAGLFDIEDVVDGITKKMIRRHPHVFGDKNLETVEDVRSWWEESKSREGKQSESIIDGVPRTLPALLRAQLIQTKASRVGFDWEKVEDVFKKLDEEIVELREAMGKRRQEEIVHELGDIFFVLVRIANFVGVNPEEALRKTIDRFISRFKYMEREALREGKRLEDLNIHEMDILWNRAKKRKVHGAGGRTRTGTG